ncbi:TonB-dependent receptor [Acinetobacter stercoris]|uniref:Pesticin receptor n=1 Tax=Acinetobacter stercoris TaxID=2126983 RepID=A0A2U3MX86_9GAMM|nr:TonB-dependent receptor [Acinetobacter stercoris]SPL69973.1 Pesticin receptor precursor [Acinetobacter stercoris]
MFKMNKIRQGILTATWGVTASISSFAFADDEVETTSPNTAKQQQLKTDDKDVKKLGDVVVTAQYRKQNIQDIPSSITSVSGKDLAAQGATYVGDLLTFSPNAAADNVEGDSRPRWYIRGLGTGDVAASTVYPVGIYADGVYLNSPVAGAGDLFDMERIEVLRGPQGTLYGKNTTAGAVNYISRKPVFSDKPNGYATVGLGSENARIFEGAVNGKLSDNLAIRGSFYSEDRDGFAKNLANGENFGDVDKKSFRIQALGKINDSWTALLNLHSQVLHGVGNNGSLSVGKYWGKYQRPAGRDADIDLDERNKIQHDGISLTINGDLGSGYNFTSITAADKTTQTYTTDSDYTPYDVARMYGDHEWKQFSQEFRISSDEKKRLSWIAGVHYFNEDLDSTLAKARVNKLLPDGVTNAQTAAAPAYQNVTYNQGNQSFAAFGNTTFKFTDKFKVTGGLRWTWEEKDIDLNLTQITTGDYSKGSWWQENAYSNAVYNPTLNANGQVGKKKNWSDFTYDITPEYQITPELKSYFRYARGFRSGGFNTGITGNLSQMNVVNPEYLDSYELGFKSELLQGNLIANAAVFYYDYKDIQTNLLVSTQGQGGGVSSVLTNGPKAEVKGAELELDYLATENLRLRLAAAYLDTEYTSFVDRDPVTNVVSADNSGNRLVRSPKYTLGVGGTYTFNLNNGSRIVVGTDANYKDREFFLVNRQNYSVDPELSQKAFTLWNANIGYYSADNKYQINAFVKNLLDKDYQTHGRPNGPVGQYVVTYGNPRQVGVSLTAKF